MVLVHTLNLTYTRGVHTFETTGILKSSMAVILLIADGQKSIASVLYAFILYLRIQ